MLFPQVERWGEERMRGEEEEGEGRGERGGVGGEGLKNENQHGDRACLGDKLRRADFSEGGCCLPSPLIAGPSGEHRIRN